MSIEGKSLSIEDNYTFSIENLLRIWEKCKKGKNNKMDFMRFEYHLEDNIWDLHKDLISMSYKHGNYSHFFISDTKKRSINNATVRDKILHKLLFDKLGEALYGKLIYHLYSSRKEKGFHRMLKYIRKCVRNIGYNKQCYVLHVDVKKYFDSIDHEILKNLVYPFLNTSGLKYIAQKIIESFHTSPNKGIPLGNITSQLFANLYLVELDWFIIRTLGLKMYARYNDDIFIINEDIKLLQKTSKIIADWLGQERSLSVPKNKIKIYKLSQGVPALGYKIFIHHVLLKNATKQRMFERISDKNSASYFGLLEHCENTHLNQKVRSIFERNSKVI